MDKDTKTPISLPIMAGTGVKFETKNKKYTIFPLLAAHIPQFMEDNLFLGNGQIFALCDEDKKKLINKWIGGETVTAIIDGRAEISARYCYDENNKPMSLEKAISDGWDVVDFKKYFQKLCDLSD